MQRKETGKRPLLPIKGTLPSTPDIFCDRALPRTVNMDLYTLDDIWSDFESNGSDGGTFGDFDRILLRDISFDPVIARPTTTVRSRVSMPPPAPSECKFCKNNGQPKGVYSSHDLKDRKGNCSCPILRRYKCPTCGASGDKAHTLKYCPNKRIFTEADTLRIHRRRQQRLPSC